MPSQPHAVRQLSQRESRNATVRLLPLPLGEVALRSNDGEGKDADERKKRSMNEPEKIAPRELSPLALAFVGDSVLELLVRQRLVEHHRLSAGKLNAEKVKYVSARAQFREEQLLEPLFTAGCLQAGPQRQQGQRGQARLPGGVPRVHRLRVPAGLAVSERPAEPGE